jgi:NAD(P)-dependent dehydrogenase (short-subunit alcohol dehydrogenase family)
VNLGLQNKIAVVTGGSSGIGLATAKLLVEEGAKVAICGRDPGRLALAEKQISNVRPGSVLAECCNVLDSKAVTVFAEKVSEWADGTIDILINNAGQGRISTFENTTDEQWRNELELKFFSQILPIRAYLPLLQRSDAAAIVAVNALVSLQPEPHMVCSSAARAGVLNLTKSLAMEFAPGIRVNSVLLGIIDSTQWQRRFEARADKSQSRQQWTSDLAQGKHIPVGRLGMPEEPARAIIFLGSPAASFITGASLEISGGASRHI